ncbi:MAG: hypothetical protein Q8J85_04710 [Sulfuricurvum sp.]|nr:hypothetical protein [Sulfuricurvum sp.]MDP3022706.1 hypothetical protein [Sulfuricurvum sp.]
MKRKDQMLIILELLNDIDRANTIGGEDSIEYYGQVQNRTSAILDQYPKNDPFYKVVSWLFNDVHIKLEEVFEKLSSEATE